MPCAPAKANPTNTDTRKLVPFSEFTQEACLTSATRSPLRRSHQGKALFLEQSHYRRWGIKQPSGNADNVPFLTFDIHELASHSSLPSSEKRDTAEGLCTPTLFQSSGGAVAPSVSDRPPSHSTPGHCAAAKGSPQELALSWKPGDGGQPCPASGFRLQA